MKKRNVVVYIACSLDGFIAKPDGDISFLSVVEKEGEDYGYTAFMETVDTVITGRKTYDKVLAMGYGYPHTNKEAYVVTRTPQPPKDGLTFYSGNLIELVKRLKQQEGQNIYLDSGAEVIGQLLEAGLIDQLIISVVPVLLGSGIRLFGQGGNQARLRLQKSLAFDSGLVQLHYSL